MVKQLQRLIQIKKPDGYDDTLDGSEVEGSESSSVDLDDALNGVFSQLKRIIHGDRAGNWYDDINSVFLQDVSLYSLLQMIDGFNEDRILTNSDFEILINEDGNVLVGT